VLIAEALAQLAGIVAFAAAMPGAAAGAPPRARLARVDVKFTAQVSAPATIVLQAAASGRLGSLHVLDVSAEREGVTVASGAITLANEDVSA
jgi:3-hydroxymyristoyl/3-hydroxydecanoyl-(acyl carrier protein) dehydratase